MPQLHTYIREAIDNLDDRKSQRDPLNRGHDPFDVFIDLIVKEIEEETEGKLRELRISEDFYKTKIERIIENVADAEDPIGEFHSQLDEVEEEIRDDHQEYRILFPLNFQHRRAPGFEPPIKIRDVEFWRISHRSWKNFQEKACDQTNFDVFLEKLPTEENRSKSLSQHQYWEVRYEASESNFAINRIEYALKILLGKIAFASKVFIDSYAIRPGIWRYGTIVLKEPICYLVIEDDEVSKYYVSTDYTPRKQYSLSGNSKSRFEEVYPHLPDFEGELGKLEKHLASALKSYFGAISEPENETQLRRYWQCLEAATLIQENKYSASDPLKRARTAVRPMLDFEINEERIKRLTAKRNSLVHEGGQPNITEGDVDYLKTTADYSIRFLVMNMDDYTFDQFKNLYRFGSKSEGSLIQAKAHREKKLHDQKERIEELENEIESIDQIMDWLEIEERD